MSLRKSQVGRFFVVVTLSAAALGVVACGGSSSGTSEKSAASGSVEGNGKQLVFFTLASLNAYNAQINEAVKEQGAKLGFKIKVVEAPLDQAAQNQQIQQFLASKQKPTGFLLWPMDSTASVNVTRQLSRVAPVFQLNSSVQPEAKRFLASFAGVNSFLQGEVAGKTGMQAREHARAIGRKLHSAGGNLVVFGFPTGYRPGKALMDGFLKGTASEPFNVLEVLPTNADPQTGFEAASQAIPKYRKQGIDFAFAFNNSAAEGVVKALQQNGLTPGKDVQVFTGNCSGGLVSQRAGKIFGTGIQSALIDATTLLHSAAQYLTTGRASQGEATLEALADAPPPLAATAPAFSSYSPNPQLVGDEALKSAKLWGYTVDELCPS